jgi:hypothetical protein
MAQVAKAAEAAKAFAEGFNFAQHFSEGVAITCDEAIAKAVTDLRGGKLPAGLPTGEPAAVQAAAV